MISMILTISIDTMKTSCMWPNLKIRIIMQKMINCNNETCGYHNDMHDI